MTVRITTITPDGQRHAHPTSAQNGRVELIHLPDGTHQIIGTMRNGSRKLIKAYPSATEFIIQ